MRMHVASPTLDPGMTLRPGYDDRLRPARDPEARIGVFDSGVGGLTVARALARRMAHERLVYVADQTHVPYGGRPLGEVTRFAEGLTAGLFAAGTKVVVMGCNISSAVALPELSTRLPPGTIFGVVEPGARAALARSRRRRVGVLATEGTVASGAYHAAVTTQDPNAHVVQVACPDFVPLVERGDLRSRAAHEAARRALAPLHPAGVDVVVLGCTHYPFLLETLRAEAPEGIVFIDPAEATAHEVAEALRKHGRLRESAHPEPHRLLTSGRLESFRAQLADFAPELAGSVGRARWQP